MEDNGRLKTLVQAGAIGLCILLIALIWGIVNKFIDAQLLQLEVIRENTEAIQRLSNLLENPMTANILNNLTLKK